MVAGSSQLNDCICKLNYKMETGRININENLWQKMGGRMENKRVLKWCAEVAGPA